MQSQEGEQRRRRWEAPPPYIRGETPIEVKNPEGDLVTKGDWACLTMGVRVRKEILSRVARDNEGFFERCPEARRRFDVLCQELDNPGQVRLSLLERSCEAGEEDLESWNDYMRQVGVGEGENGVTWLSAPWCLAEFLIYRRLAGEIFRYWDGESGGGDPFILQKRQGCMSSLPNLSPLCAKLLEKFPSKEDDGVTSLSGDPSVLFPFFLSSLWGNQADLSLWPVEEPGGEGGRDGETEEKGTERPQAPSGASLLADDSGKLLAYLKEKQQLGKSEGNNFALRRVDFVTDNAGFELLTDLLLAEALLSSGIAGEVRMQVKYHPTFVSDACASDVDSHISSLCGGSMDRKEEGVSGGGGQMKEKEKERLRLVGERLRRRREKGQLTVIPHPFWSQGIPMWEMARRHEKLERDLKENSDLCIVKGDANYRRLLGDRQWELSIPFSEVCGYWPCPLLALRTLKAEMGVGMDWSLMAKASKEFPNEWMINGHFGVVQFTS
uniref:Sugar phosphate phosphatase n=1 Tax=Chromera velia CCMP2878 TaxID=1169474 RepID=A0A0G4H227_9ALVE|eukprot:Cvel_24383.t1-p1 / transcript=Cvel_24383.t1 / gene=Cvel_24383 / organism=Chromera_velia_CCMP2878 / gene_product=UPF0364 protein C6orf211 homolog, putative / transcript_product=UPF0364 protein C6orf211 homolog, putative / location=Cvel_scaffold2628:11615-13926(-) / protein_length=495 / sequence_SO=supercontig / SO=protein_coding / is_pseudo=false